MSRWARLAHAAGYRESWRGYGDDADPIPDTWDSGTGASLAIRDGYVFVACEVWGRRWQACFDQSTPDPPILAAMEAAGWPEARPARLLTYLRASLRTQLAAHGVTATDAQAEAVARNLAQWLACRTA